MTKQSNLFKFSCPVNLNACIGDSFSDYGYIYRRAALLLLNLLIIANNNDELQILLKTHLFSIEDEHIVSPNNDYVISVIFLYRHSIELDLKSLLLTLKSKECISKNTTPNRKKIIDKLKKHSLSNIWNMVNPLLQKYYKASDCKNLIKTISKQLKELDDFDPDSTSFRYPYKNNVDNNEFVKNLNGITHINLLVFYEEINKLCDNIDKFKYYFQDEYDFFNRILVITDSSYYRDLSRKKTYISTYQYDATIHKIKLLCERFIEPNKNILNKNLIRDLFLLNKITEIYCEKRKKGENDEEILKEINNTRSRIRYQCKKIIGINKHYY